MRIAPSMYNYLSLAMRLREERGYLIGERDVIHSVEAL